MEADNGFYKIGTKNDVLPQLFTRNQLEPFDNDFISCEDMPDVETSFSAAVGADSPQALHVLDAITIKKDGTIRLIIARVLISIDNAIAHIDDVLISTPKQDFEAHLNTLRTVFERFREFKLKSRGDKCTFTSSEIIFLGHKITKEGYEPSPTNVKVILNYPTSANALQVKSFYGTIFYT
uniref:Polyprotein n=1 Tax=Acrobeloides nanus TaxID=290746 RepID=A0A914CPU3_9BILA